MSRGGSKTHIQPLIPWGGRMRSSLKLPREPGVAEVTPMMEDKSVELLEKM